MMTDLKNIRNFAIISHIDHGKSTLADRFLEITNTVSKREMKAQFLDNMELEREKGITIKMRPVRMIFHLKNHSDTMTFNSEYILNLIDTPGHIDFSYEVSRALAATEGVILLVDATQGAQAQTVVNIDIARGLNLKIIPAVNKIDARGSRVEQTKKDIIKLLNCEKEEILEISGKTGQGTENMLYSVIYNIPSPETKFKGEAPRALIFDFEYSEHKGIIAFIRVVDGVIKKDSELYMIRSGIKFKIRELGVLAPDFSPRDNLSAGEIGYIVTNFKEPSAVRVGDTIISAERPLTALIGYKEPKPVIWANFFSSRQAEFTDFKKALMKLSLNDSSFTFEEINAEAVGRGFRLGFLGMLHMEIIAQRLRREFKIETINTIPSVSYLIKYKNGGEEKIYSAADFPEEHEMYSQKELWVDASVLVPHEYMNEILKLLQEFEAQTEDVINFSPDRLMFKTKMPLRELMRGFFDRLKSVSSGYASFNYEIGGTESEWRASDLARLDILINEEEVAALSRITPKHRLQKEAEEIVEKLKNLLPPALFQIKIQAKARGRILSSRTISALKKNVTAHLYGGDRTRKMKLWQKQKKGKAKLKEKSNYQIPPDVFLKIMIN